jgi:hypothetical protein
MTPSSTEPPSFDIQSIETPEPNNIKAAATAKAPPIKVTQAHIGNRSI